MLTLELWKLDDFLKLPSLSIPLSIYIYGDLAVTATNIFKTKPEAKKVSLCKQHTSGSLCFWVFFWGIIYLQCKALCGKFQTKNCTVVKQLCMAIHGAVL